MAIHRRFRKATRLPLQAYRRGREALKRRGARRRLARGTASDRLDVRLQPLAAHVLGHDLCPLASRDPAPGGKLPNDLPRSMALEQAAREVLETAREQREPACKIMAALLGIGGEQDFDAGVLKALTPETVLRLDLIADQMLELGRTAEAVRALRAALIRPAS